MLFTELFETIHAAVDFDGIISKITQLVNQSFTPTQRGHLHRQDITVSRPTDGEWAITGNGNFVPGRIRPSSEMMAILQSLHGLCGTVEREWGHFDLMITFKNIAYETKLEVSVTDPVQADSTES